jgi:hypothetical protein
MRSYLDMFYEVIDSYYDDNIIEADSFGVMQRDGSICKIEIPACTRKSRERLRLNCSLSIHSLYVVINEDVQHEGNVDVTRSQLKIQLEKDRADELNKLVYLKDGVWNNLGSLMKKCDLVGKYSKVINDTCIYPITAIIKKVNNECVISNFIGVEKHKLDDNYFNINFNAYMVEQPVPKG